MSSSPLTRIESFAEWLGRIEPIRALIVAFFLATFGLGVTWANFNGRLDSNAADLKTETAARLDGDKAIGERIDRGFKAVLDRLTHLQDVADKRAEADKTTAHELGLLRGLYEKNYGSIPEEERNRP